MPSKRDESQIDRPLVCKSVECLGVKFQENYAKRLYLYDGWKRRSADHAVIISFVSSRFLDVTLL